MDLDYLFSLLESKHYYVNRKCHFEDKGEYVSRRYLGIQNLSPTSITPKVIINTLGVIFNTFGLISFSPRQIMTSTHPHHHLSACLPFQNGGKQMIHILIIQKRLSFLDNLYRLRRVLLSEKGFDC